MSTIQIYSPLQNNKLRYVFDYLLAEQCGLSYQLIDNRADLTEKNIINYSAEDIPLALNVSYTLYLNQLIDTPEFEKDLSFDDSHNSNFDFIAAIFFLLARVEEYDSKALDGHRRFDHKESKLFKMQLLDEPVVDLWVQVFRKQLEKQFGLQLKRVSYEFHSTIDVDHIYAYKHKTLAVKAGSFFRDLLNFNTDRLADRANGKDPYDRLEDMLAWHNDLGMSPTFFVLTAQRSAYDKSLPPSSIQFIQKISSLAEQATVGIHPSYMSNSSVHILKKETRDLEAIIDKIITKSRQHYLKLSWPDTYRNLIGLGITEDYTMGYAGAIGFRGGTSRPCYWYDLHNDKQTELKLIPFQLMDVTLKQYLGYDPKRALKISKTMIDKIKAVDGCCSIIWHNSSFYEAEGWAGYETMYKELLSYASSNF